uniref:DNA/RNA non-specific endonuclease n=1 Tax=Alistipes sp. TaxID=1872444 RepID=UPI00405624E5
MKKLKNILFALQSINRKSTIVLVLILALTACGFEDEWTPPYPSKAELNGSVFTYNITEVTGVTAGVPTVTWELYVTEGNDFCTPKTRAGFAGQNFSLELTINNSEEERIAKARVVFSDGTTKILTIRQLAKTENPNYDRPWAEQPDYTEGGTLVYKTYYTTIAGDRRVRNYSICYDTDKLVPHWVAYPLHNCYIGNSGRTNEWSFDDAYYTYNSSTGYYDKSYIYTDPIIPQSEQQNIEAGGYQGNGDRGHMLPSASRTYNYNTNAQTFYATNMMPQYSRFNQGVWATLEDNVRGWRCSDTLYVVTGTLFEAGSYQFTARGRKITSPSHAFKLVLRTKSGNSGKNIADITSADDLKCIGFLFENSATGANTSIRDAVVSVAEIEERSGFKFFRNLQPEIAEEVKLQKNLSDWGL